MSENPASSLPKILMIEDSLVLQQTTRVRLEGIAEVIPAHTLEEAEMRWAEHGNSLAAISFDAEVPDAQHLTLPLIEAISASGYQGAMIAASSSQRMTKAMVAAGCQYAIERSKGELDGIMRLVLRKQENTTEPSHVLPPRPATKPPGPK